MNKKEIQNLLKLIYKNDGKLLFDSEGQDYTIIKNSNGIYEVYENYYSFETKKLHQEEINSVYIPFVVSCIEKIKFKKISF